MAILHLATHIHIIVHYQRLVSMANNVHVAWCLSAVRSSEVVRISEVKMCAVKAATGEGHMVCPLHRGCPLLGVSIIGGSTVNRMLHMHILMLQYYIV